MKPLQPMMNVHETRSRPRIERSVVLYGRRNNQCWFSPAVVALPSSSSPTGFEGIINVQQLVSNDYGPVHTLRTIDGGRSWQPPFESQNLFKVPMDDGVYESPHTLGLLFHRKTGRLFSYGNTIFSRDRGDDPTIKAETYVTNVGTTTPVYTTWDAARCDYTPWRRLAVPRSAGSEVHTHMFGLNQCCEREDGAILMPFSTDTGKYSAVGTLRIVIDGDSLVVDEVGRTFGDCLHEPSIVAFGDQYLMTIRSERGDGRMYHAASRDGVNWGDPLEWRWDDGLPVETANTQQHWLKHGQSLFLLYTRKSDLNNGVFRFRAPLYMAEVDATHVSLIRDTEQIVFPERGARMGNFSVANVGPNEVWVVTGEWLQQKLSGFERGMRFWSDGEADPSPYNRLQYVGDLLLARILF